MNTIERLIKSLEDTEFDIFQATSTDDVDELCRQALADIYGGEVAGFFSATEGETWRKRIQDVAMFRYASLKWKVTNKDKDFNLTQQEV